MTVLLCTADDARPPVDVTRWPADEYLALLGALRMTLLAEVNRRRSVRELLCSVRASNVLRQHRIQTIGDLLELSWQQVLRLDGFGMRCIVEVRDELSRLGFSHSAFHRIAARGRKVGAPS